MDPISQQRPVLDVSSARGVRSSSSSSPSSLTQKNNVQDNGDAFESPAFVFQSPTTTMSQTDSNHPLYNFPLLSNFSRMKAANNNGNDSTSSNSNSNSSSNSNNDINIDPSSHSHDSSTLSPITSYCSSSTSIRKWDTDDKKNNTNAPASISTTINATGNQDQGRYLRPDSHLNKSDDGDDNSNNNNNNTRSCTGHGRSLSVENSPLTVSSRSSSRRGSTQFLQPIEVKETLNASVVETADGHLQLKQYVLKRIIGRGAYGIVNLGVDVNTGIKYAIKEFSKSKLRRQKKNANLFTLGRGRGRAPLRSNSSESSPLELIRGEIAILKKLNHDNIVRLYEVLDVATEDSMFMVFELCERGVLTDVSLGDKVGKIFSDEECRDVFQQIVLGIEYLHEHDIVHRDIKPENLLLSADGTLKIVDFGVSEMFTKKGDDMTKKSAGSPAFMAPELCQLMREEVSGRAMDIWSMGVTLYCIRYGRLPFRFSNTLDLHRAIREDEPDLESEKDPRFKNVMKRLLEKDPAKRITLDELREDPWLTDDGRDKLICKEDNTKNAVVDVSDADLDNAFQRLQGIVAVLKAFSKFKSIIKSQASKSAAQEVAETTEVIGERGISAPGASPALMSLCFQGAAEPSVSPSELAAGVA